MVLEALESEGGVEYLRKVAREEPKSFIALLGRLLPRQVDVDANVNHSRSMELVAAIQAGRQRVAAFRDAKHGPSA